MEPRPSLPLGHSHTAGESPGNHHSVSRNLANSPTGNISVSAEESHRFEYQPLAEGEIRLIRFLDADDLRCELKHFHLDHAPPYWALSYTWGTETATNDLFLNDRTLAIRQNLSLALARIGKRVKDEHIYLWVDAICINQEDVSERDTQVLRMRSIYADASLVAIWLGEHLDRSELAIESIVRFSNRRRFPQSPEGGNHKYVDLRLALEIGIGTLTAQEIQHAVSKLFQRPWFDRLWIIQESTASNCKIFFVGNDTLRWEDLIAWGWVSDVTALYTGHYQRFDRLHQISKDRQLGSTENIFSLCRRFRMRHCTDPRDRIYSLAGIASDLEGVNYAAKYSLSVQDVYIDDFVRLQLRISPKHSQIDFLGCVIRVPAVRLSHSKLFGDVYDTLPSWVPDWRLRLDVFPLLKPPLSSAPRGTSFEREGKEQEYHERFYSASKDTIFQCHIANVLQLHVRGFTVDWVLQLSPTMERAYIPIEQDGPAEDWALSNGDEMYNAAETKEQAFFRTITADIWYGRSAIKRPHSYERREIEATENQQELFQNRRSQETSHFSMVAVTYGRKFMWTKEGRMGLAPAAADINDKICVFFGGQVLYIIREVEEGKHEFMGECYVHGLMDGEALHPDGCYQEQVEDFVLV